MSRGDELKGRAADLYRGVCPGAPENGIGQRCHVLTPSALAAAATGRSPAVVTAAIQMNSLRFMIDILSAADGHVRACYGFTMVPGGAHETHLDCCRSIRIRRARRRCVGTPSVSCRQVRRPSHHQPLHYVFVDTCGRDLRLLDRRRPDGAFAWWRRRFPRPWSARRAGQMPAAGDREGRRLRAPRSPVAAVRRLDAGPVEGRLPPADFLTMWAAPRRDGAAARITSPG